jgi:hypothetical protein
MKRKQFRLKLKWDNRSPLIATAIGFIVAFVGLYCYQLTHLMPASASEQQTIQSLEQVSDIINNPLVLPFKLLAGFLLQLPGDSLRSVRLASVIISLVTVGLFYMLARRWYGQLNGLASTILFASSGWLLTTGRFGAGYTTLTLLILGVLNITVWVNSTENSNRAIALFSLVCSVALLVPGGLWFVLAAFFICRQAIAEHLRETKRSYLAIGAGCFVFVAAILSIALARDPSLVRQWLGLPAEVPGLMTILKQFMLSITGFIVRGPVSPELWLAHTPLLDVAATALVALGVLFYRRHLRNARTHLLLLFILIGAILTALNGPVGLSYLLPLVYLVLGGGIAYLLHQWKKVFPRNPIAEGAAYCLVGFLMLCMVSFHVQRYFIAWHYSPSTINTYQQEQATTSKSLPYLIQ